MPLDPQKGSKELETSSWTENRVSTSSKVTEFDQYLDGINEAALADYVFNGRQYSELARDDDYYLYHLGVSSNTSQGSAALSRFPDKADSKTHSDADPKGCYIVEVRINRRTKSKTLQQRMSGSSSLPHLKTTLAIVLVQPDTNDHVGGEFIKHSFRLSPTGDVVYKIEVKFGRNRNGPFGGLERTEIRYVCIFLKYSVLKG